MEDNPGDAELTAEALRQGKVANDMWLAEDGEADVGTQDAFELGQIGDFVFAQMSAEGSGVEGGRAHNVIVRSPKSVSKNYNIKIAPQRRDWTCRPDECLKALKGLRETARRERVVRCFVSVHHVTELLLSRGP